MCGPQLHVGRPLIGRPRAGHARPLQCFPIVPYIPHKSKTAGPCPPCRTVIACVKTGLTCIVPLSPVNEFYGQSRGPGMPGPYSVSLLYHTFRAKAKLPAGSAGSKAVTRGSGSSGRPCHRRSGPACRCLSTLQSVKTCSISARVFCHPQVLDKRAHCGTICKKEQTPHNQRTSP